MTTDSPFAPGNCAVVTGGASGIGLAAAKRFAARGSTSSSPTAGRTTRHGGARSRRRFAERREERARRADRRQPARRGRGARTRGDFDVRPGRHPDEQRRDRAGQFDARRLGGAGGASSTSTSGASSMASKAFAPGMIASGRPAMIVNTGSKQGITTPPGDPAYNVVESRREGRSPKRCSTSCATSTGCKVTRIC